MFMFKQVLKSDIYGPTFLLQRRSNQPKMLDQRKEDCFSFTYKSAVLSFAVLKF